jgi:hypothetical protein
MSFNSLLAAINASFRQYHEVGTGVFTAEGHYTASGPDSAVILAFLRIRSRIFAPGLRAPEHQYRVRRAT